MIDSQVIEKLRRETPGCENKIHLNNAGAGLMPSPVLTRMIEHLELEAKIGGYEAAELKDHEIQEFYQLAGRLVNCSSRNIAYTNSATDSYSRALSSIPFIKGDILLTTITFQIKSLFYHFKTSISYREFAVIDFDEKALIGEKVH